MATPTLPPPAEVSAMAKLMFAVAATAPFPELKIEPLVAKLLENETYAREILDPLFVPAGANTIETLEGIQGLIPLLPQDSKGRTGTIVYCVLLGVATLAVILRFYSRAIVVKKVRLDDWMALVTLLLFATTTALFSAMNKYTYHIWDDSFEMIQSFFRIVFVVQIIFALTHIALKSTFLIFYYNLSTDRLYRLAIWAVFSFVVIFSLLGIFIGIFQCRPINYWDHMGTMKCLNRLAILESLGIMYILADFMILTLPIALVWKLQLQPKEKIIVISIFAVGGFVCIAGINRLLQVKVFFTSPDPMYHVVDHNIWAILEITLSLTIACLPALRMLFFPRIKFQSVMKPTRAPGTIGTEPFGKRRPSAKSSIILYRGFTALGSVFSNSTSKTDIATGRDDIDISRGSTGEQRGTPNSEIKIESKEPLSMKAEQQSTAGAVPFDVEKGIVAEV